MPYATNPTDGMKIHYDVEGEGPPLVLHHGPYRSLEGWRDEGYTDSLKKDHRLIALDARGHGQSGKPHKADSYSMELRVSDVTSILDELGVEQAHYFGYSMGAHTGFGLLKHAPERIASFVLGGMAPDARDPEPLNRRAQALRAGMEPVVAASEIQAGERMAEPRRSTLLANDAEALAELTLAIRDTPSLEDGLAPAMQPCLIFAGDQDPVHDFAQRAAEQIPNGSFVSLPGLAHLAGFQRSDVVLPHVTEFLASVAASP